MFSSSSWNYPSQLHSQAHPEDQLFRHVYLMQQAPYIITITTTFTTTCVSHCDMWILVLSWKIMNKVEITELRHDGHSIGLDSMANLYYGIMWSLPRPSRVGISMLPIQILWGITTMYTCTHPPPYLNGRDARWFDHVPCDVACVVLYIVLLIKLLPAHTNLKCCAAL